MFTLLLVLSVLIFSSSVETEMNHVCLKSRNTSIVVAGIQCKKRRKEGTQIIEEIKNDDDENNC